jgi:hypothetical protein
MPFVISEASNGENDIIEPAVYCECDLQNTSRINIHETQETL